MIRQSLADQYRLLAGKFAEEGLAVEALGCLTAAVQLDRSAGREEVRRLLASMADLDFDRQPDRSSPKLARLLRRKQKLDEQVARERRISQSIDTPDPAPPLPRSGESIPDDLARRLVRLEVRLSGIDGARYERAHRRVKILLDECCPDGPPALEPSEGTPEIESVFSGFGDALSVEHELHNLANDFYQLERYDEAIWCYDLALEINGELLETYFNRGLAHTRKREYDRAEGDLSKVIEMNPKLGEAWYTRGLIRQYQEEYDDAIADFEKADELGYDKAQTQLLVARQKRDESGTRRKGNDSDEGEGRIRDFSPYLTKPACTLADVGGHGQVKRRLRTIVAYLKGDPILDEWGAELPRGVLLCGRPGIGKTHLARCLAGEAQCSFYAPPTSVFEDMWAGNMQKNLRRLWEQASEHERAIIFLDEFDSLGSRRTSAKAPDAWYNRMVGCILELMDNLARRSQRLVVIAATNRKENIDAAFLRPGRFTYVIEVDSPTAYELAEIWLIHLDAATSRAKRVDFLTDPLLEAVLADRQEWLPQAFRSSDVDPTGIVRLARLSEQKDLVGDDVREVIRRTIDERVMAALDCRLDLGPIGPDDLYRQLEDYESGLREDEGDED
ncbi:MAG TPA: AAA family ATPase [Thermoguttaceae bacterium]|nr:AAA family ATPase [Thermoguttaceae bacterium]